VAAAATVACTSGSEAVIAGTSVPGTALVALPTFKGGVQLLTFSLASVSIEDTGVNQSNPIHLLVDGDDEPALVTTIGIVGYYAPAEPEWSYELISEGNAGYDGFRDGGAAFTATGNVQVLYSGGYDSVYELAERTAPGSWTSRSIKGDVPLGFTNAMTVDSLGRTSIVARSYIGEVVEWVEGTVVEGYPSDTSVYDALPVAAGSDGMLGVLRVAPSEVGVTFSDGTSVTNDQVLATMTQFDRLDDCLARGVCEDTTCDRIGTQSDVALTSTEDGTFWAAYVVSHQDQDWAATEDAGGDCEVTIVDDRSSQELLLVRLDPNGAAAPSERWRFAMPYDGYLRGVSLAASGERLYLAVGHQPGNTDQVTHLFALDWTSL
jgi:hypothetical protein